MVFCQREVHDPHSIAPLQSVSTSESEAEEPILATRHGASGVVVLGLLALGVVGYANHRGANSNVVDMGSHGNLWNHVVKLDAEKKKE